MKRKAFTLIELLVVISIIILLVGILVPAFNAAMRRAKIEEGRTYIAAIGQGCEDFRNDHRVYPGQRSFTGLDSNSYQTSMGELLAKSLLYYDFNSNQLEATPVAGAYVDYNKGGLLPASYFKSRNLTYRLCFSDKFTGAEMPILYYPANRGNNGLFVNKAFEIPANTSIITNADTLCNGTTLPAHQVVGGYCWDDQAMKAINYDTYLLIGPGDDRKYFYNIAGDEIDDITNFRN